MVVNGLRAGAGHNTASTTGEGRQQNNATVPASVKFAHKPASDTVNLSNRVAIPTQPDSISRNNTDKIDVSRVSQVATKDVQTMQEFVNKAVYSRDLAVLLKPESGFKVTGKDDRVTIKNIWYKDPNSKVIQGLCGDLASGVGEKLSQNPQFKNYEFKYVTGFSNLFDTRPKELFPKDKPPEGDHAFIQFWPKSNPEEKWVIDPSYGVVKRATDLPGYTIGHSSKDGRPMIRDFDEVSPPPRDFAVDLELPKNGSSETTLLGLAKNLMPEATKEYPPNARVYISFARNQDGRIESRLSLLERPDSQQYTELPRFWGQPGDSAAANSPLKRFMVKVDQDLAEYNRSLPTKAP